MRIVRAPESDWQVVSEFAQKTFAATFSEVFTPENLALHLARAYTRERMEAEFAAEETYLLYTEEDAVTPAGLLQLRANAAHAQLGPPLDGGSGETEWQLHRFYLASHAQGAGVGARLMEFALQRLREAGATRVWLSVHPQNSRARRFYEKAGFR